MGEVGLGEVGLGEVGPEEMLGLGEMETGRWGLGDGSRPGKAPHQLAWGFCNGSQCSDHDRRMMGWKCRGKGPALATPRMGQDQAYGGAGVAPGSLHVLGMPRPLCW